MKNRNHLFQPGQSGNPKGRPKGRFSITNQIIQRLKENPKEAKEIIDWLIAERKDLIWQMIDPRPPQDLNVDGEIRLPLYLPSELLEKNDIPQITEGDRE